MTKLVDRTVTMMTKAEARARREEIIRQLGGDEQAFRDRAYAYALDAEELALFDELEGLDYLLDRIVA